MKLYFVASPRSIAKEPELYQRIYHHLAKDNKMLSDLVLNLSKGDVDDFYEAPHSERIEHYKRTMEAVKKAEMVIIEVSQHSMSMGYIVNKALEIGKPVIALYKKGFEPYFFSGIEDPKLQIVEYEEAGVESALDGAIEKTRNLVDVRFNFFVSPQILAYLDFVAKERMIPRSVFLRDLIEKEMKKDKKFKEE